MNCSKVALFGSTISNVGSMLGHRLRRWPNIDPTFAQYIVLVGNKMQPSRMNEIKVAQLLPSNVSLKKAKNISCINR